MKDLVVLNDKQRKFCEEYAIDLNATAAALRAGYQPASAANTGCRLLRLPEVQELVAELSAAQQEKKRELFNKVTEELVALAFSDIGDFVSGKDAGGDVNLKNISETRTVASFHITSHSGHTNVHLKMYDKLKALKMLVRHLGFYEDKAGEGSECIVKALLQGQLPEQMLNPENYLQPEMGHAEAEQPEPSL